MGLLDFLQTDEGRLGLGLLAAAGPRSDGAGFGQRINEAYGQQDAYKSRQQEAAYRKAMFEQQQQAMDAARAEKQQQIAEAARISGLIAGAGQSFGATDKIEGALPEGLRIPGMAAQQVPIDYQALFRQGVPAATLKALADSQNLGRQEVARTEDSTDAQGRPIKLQLDRFGAPVGQGLQQWKAPVEVALGDRKQFIDPVTMQARAAFNVNQSPDSRANNAVAMRGQNMTDARGRELNQITREIGITEKEFKIDELRDKAEARKRGKQASIDSVQNQIAVIDKALTHPGRETATGLSGTVDPRNYTPGTDARNFQVVLDQIGGTAFLQAFESLKGGGQITEVEGKKATDAMARLSRAQSDTEFKIALQDLRQVMAQGQARLTGGASTGGASGSYGDAPKPMLGMVRGGYKYKGGDPAQQSNWEKQ